MVRVMKFIDEFRRGWQGISQPSALFSIGFSVFCLALATAARWGLAQLRSDIFFTPYIPAVFLATAVGGMRLGLAMAVASGALGTMLDFGERATGPARVALLVIFWVVCGLTIWGVQHYRSTVARQREDARRLGEAEEYRKLVVEELQHRLKNKLSTIHAVLHQLPTNQPQIWALIDHRLRALAATDDLISRVDGAGCDIKDLLLSGLSPYGHVRFTLDGEPLYLPAKLAVSLALIFHELATNAGKYGAFSSARGLLQVSWALADGRLNLTWDETGGPAIDQVGEPGFGTRLLQSALTPFDGKTEIAFLKTGVHCTMQCRIPKS
jgi:two-component sensor histidine kinase